MLPLLTLHAIMPHTIVCRFHICICSYAGWIIRSYAG